MKYLLILGAAAILAGCGKKDQPAPPTQPEKASQSIDAVIKPAGDQPPPPPVPVPQAPAPGTSTSGSEPNAAAIIPGASNRPGEPMDPKGVKAAIDRYFDRMGSFPNSWQQLIAAKMLTAVPKGKNGQPLDFGQCQEWFASNK